MDPQNLQTASHYLNNLLLARGLLRDATPLEFASPAAAKGGLESTMTKVISLVHDLVLRRDVRVLNRTAGSHRRKSVILKLPRQRETETLSTLSQNLLTLRTAASQQTHTIARLEDRAADLERQLATAVSRERSAQSALQAAEKRNRGLRDDATRLKASVGQVRAQCVHDVRRRDAEIKRLQKHLEPRWGGGGRESAAPVGVTVVHPAAPRKPQAGAAGAVPGATGANGADVEGPEYSLRDETTEFLTQLSTELSDENDALITLAHSTIATLSSLQGLPPPDPAAAATIDSSLASSHSDPNIATTAPPSTTLLAAQTSSLLAHLQELLTDPGFVRVEELHARDAELARLRAGWDRVEARWREAVGLMRGWRERLAAGGDTLRLEDLGAGLELGEGEVQRVVREKERMGSSPPRPEDVVGRPRARRSSGSASGSGVDSSMVSVELPPRVGADNAGADDDSAPRKRPSMPARRASSLELDVDLGIALLPTPAVLRPVAGNVRRGSPRAARRGVTRAESALQDALGSDDDAGVDDVRTARCHE